MMRRCLEAFLNSSHILIVERGDGDDDPLLSVPDRDAKEKTLIMERGDGMRPGASDEDDTLLSVPDRDVKETSWTARMLSKGVGGLGLALKELRRRLSKTGRAAGEGQRSRPTGGHVRPGIPQEVPRV